ncbi:MAG: hydroxyacid dehydrogenase [Lachnospiraceae bacterium]|nr:hydroxyacid dehydrogenase [Lachnospiraceae bacterium]
MMVVLTHPLAPEAMDILRDNGAEVYVANSPEPETYLDELKDAEVFIVRVGECRAGLIEKCPKLKVIGRTGVGYDNVDVAFAAERGIPTVITPGANQRSVAEYAFGMIFALSKDLMNADRELRAGNWEVRNARRSFDLLGKTIGVIGLGAIGREVIKIAHGLGMQVSGYDPFLSQEKAEALGVRYYGDYRELLKDADVVTIHVPLTDGTRDMITAAELSTMKKTALLINCSRGGIVNEEDLAKALDAGTIAGAGADAFTTEPVVKGNVLFSAKNMIMTPHAAAQSREAFINMSVACAKGCMAIVCGEEWTHVVDASAYENRKK